MRLLLTHGAEANSFGQRRYTVALSQALVQGGYSVTVLAAPGVLSSQDRQRIESSGARLDESLPLPQGDIERMGETSIGEHCRSLGEIIDAQIAALRPTAILAHQFSCTAHATAMVAQACETPITVITQGEELHLLRPGSAHVALARATFERATARIAVSGQVCASLSEALQVSSQRVEIVPVGTSVQAARSWPARTRPVAALYVAPLRFSAGPQLLLASLPKLVSHHPELRLTFVGDGPDGEHLSRLVQALNGGDRNHCQLVLDELSTTPERTEQLSPVRKRFLGTGPIPLAGELDKRVRFLEPLRGEQLWPELMGARVLVLAEPDLLSSGEIVDALACGCFVAGSSTDGVVADLTDRLEESAPEAVRRPRASGRAGGESVGRTIRHALDEWTTASAALCAEAVQLRHNWRAIATRLLPHPPSAGDARRSLGL